MEPTASLKNIFRLKLTQERALSKLRLETVNDLLYHFPSRYVTPSATRRISELVSGECVTVYGKLDKLKTGKAFRKKIPLGQGIVSDDSGSVKVIWFNQPYVAKMLHNGSFVKISGKVQTRKGALYFANPEVETGLVPTSGIENLFGKEVKPAPIPIYPESRGVTSLWISRAIDKIIRSGTLEKISDPIPEKILKRYNLPDIKSSLIWIHRPQKSAHFEAARKRFAFEEVFFIQLMRGHDRLSLSKEPSYRVTVNEKTFENLIKRFPFSPTNAQKRALKDVLEDMSKSSPMSRLLEGDVGSGKTLVAAAASYAVTLTRPEGKDFGNLQTTYMAPTEILAEQHFQSFIEYFKGSGVQIGLLTGSSAKKLPSKVNPNKPTDVSRAQLLRWVSNGEIPILIGTHALIEKSVRFKHLALVIIDEQHRFGVNQRRKLLRNKGFLPHLLSMTATPIPRTLALTIYGDLDISLIDEMPPGRKPIITEIVPPDKRKDAYEKIKVELKKGRQVYVICPRIDEPNPSKQLAILSKSVKTEAKRLAKEIFPNYRVESLHGKLKPSEKEKVMSEFKEGLIDILVATSVIEVGVNVPNATVIVIEGAERFGLAQLYQLRGRVLRSEHQAYCFVFADSGGEKTLVRLRALVTAKNGFELSEIDLKLRGAGELSGEKQWGLSDIGMEAIKNLKMVEAARKEAMEILEDDPELVRYPKLREKIDSQKTPLHFE